MITHDDASELLAAFALDAVEGDEYRQIEEHLAGCPRCRAEVDAHREVAAALGNSVETLPEGLWSSISGGLPPRHDHAPLAVPRLWRDGLTEVGIQQAAPRPRRIRSARGRMATVASLAVGAAAVAAVLGINLAHADNRVAHLQVAMAETAHATVLAALETPGHKVVNLESQQHMELAQFVVLRNGQGYLVKSKLPPAPSKETYQLWGVINGQTISLGLLGRTPHLVTFTLAGSTHPSRLGVTVEPAGGSVQPTSPMLASGTV